MRAKGGATNSVISYKVDRNPYSASRFPFILRARKSHSSNRDLIRPRPRQITTSLIHDLVKQASGRDCSSTAAHINVEHHGLINYKRANRHSTSAARFTAIRTDDGPTHPSILVWPERPIVLPANHSDMHAQLVKLYEEADKYMRENDFDGDLSLERARHRWSSEDSNTEETSDKWSPPFFSVCVDDDKAEWQRVHDTLRSMIMEAFPEHPQFGVDPPIRYIVVPVSDWNIYD
jgi:hypothetical protein